MHQASTSRSVKPAILGGPAGFPEGIPFARPLRPPLERVVERLRPSYDAGILTNGPLGRQLEEEAAERLGVAEVVAVSSCTTGLILALCALGLEGPVVVPSFTFSASAHAIHWNGLEPRFADCDDATFQLDPGDAAGRLEGAAGVLATHVFGAPCEVEALEGLAERAGVPIVFDAAHAFGATHGGRPIGGNGAAEVFSLTPTKLVVGGEGGLVATNDPGLAATVRLGREYGNPGNYDTRFPGLNGRLSEMHAALALESLALLDDHLVGRRALADRYRSALAGVPGIGLQVVAPGDVSTYKDFTIRVEPADYGLGRDRLVDALRAEGVDTRCYFEPPVHRQQAYRHLELTSLPVTEAVAGSVLSLPLYLDLPEDAPERIAGLLASLHEAADEVAAAAS